MQYFARKISRPKWEVKPFMNPDEISADAITSCLRTTNNTLSLWECSTREDHISEVILAIVTSMDRIDRIHIILLRRDELEADGLTLISNPGNTPIVDLRDRHVDVVNLEMKKLCSIARKRATNVRNDQDFHQFTRAHVKEMLRDTVMSDRVGIDQLKENVQRELINAL